MRYLISLFAAAGLFVDRGLAQDSSPCAAVAALVSKGASAVDAQQAVDCLRSVPINQKAALRFIDIYNATNLQFHSTAAYLKDPPRSYQQPAADLNDALNVIQVKVNNGSYSSQYDFEADIQALTHSAHDGHLGAMTGALSVFLFQPPMTLTSISDNGQNVPQVYSFDDLVQTTQKKASFTPSPLKQINGKNAVAYLEDWASKYENGFSEPHTDWNGLMSNAAEMLSPSNTGWTGSYLFSDEYMNVTFANGTTKSMKWTARVQKNQVKLLQKVADGASFYQSFVVPLASSATPTKSRNATKDDAKDAAGSGDSSSPSASGLAGWPLDAYPSPSLVQPGLQQPLTGGKAFLTGYTVKDASLAVLSIPSFEGSGAPAQQFAKTVSDFIKLARDAKVQNVLFDVQGNGGGDPLLAYEIYKQFFPAAKPFSGARARVSTLANTIGKAISDGSGKVTEDQLDALLEGSKSIGASPWLAQLYNDAVTGEPFTSWDDWLQPNVQEKGDAFTKAFILNFNRSDFDRRLSGSGGANGIVLDGFGDRAGDAQQQQPFAAQKLAILTDGQCTSTCTLFVELFHHQAGVKVVAAGGRPVTGPMQGAAGSRGAQSYSSKGQLFADIGRVAKGGPAVSDVDSLPDTSDTGIRWLSGGFNLWDQVRLENGKQSVPLQFTYNAADCRIFYTRDTFNNYTALWSYAANAIFKDQSACVPGSTGQPSAGNITDTTGPTVVNTATTGSGSGTSSPSTGGGSFKTDPSGAPAPSATGAKSGSARTIVGGAASLVVPCLAMAVLGFL